MPTNLLLRGFPLSYKSHVLTCLLLGNLITYDASLLLLHPLWIKSHSLVGLDYVPPTRAEASSSALSSVETQHWSTVGLLITSFGLANIAAANEPGGWSMAREMAKLRVVAAALTGLVWIFKPESRDMVKALMMLEDGVGGLICCWQMGPRK